MDVRSSVLLMFPVLALNLLVPHFAQAAINPATVQKLVAGDRTTNSYFGATVSVDGDTALIGATPDNKRIAYVFVRAADGKWTEQAKLIPSDGGSGSYLDTSVALNGDTALVGDDWEGTSGQGAVYVFVRSGSTWSQQAKLIASNSDNSYTSHFGSSMSIDGDTALIAARGDGADSSHTIAYVFVRSGITWTQQEKIIIDTTNGGNYAVSLDGSTALIGASGDDNGKGAAYIFVRSGTTWIQQAKLIDPEGLPDDNVHFGDWFGYAVSLDGDAALIGAPRNNRDSYQSKGAAYIFVRSGTSWTRQTKVTTADDDDNREFGNSVSLSGNTALIGADNYHDRAYLFTRSADGIWTQQIRFSQADSWFGWSVSLDNSTALIGAIGDNSRTGAAYVYSSSSSTVNKAGAMPAMLRLLLGK